MRFVQDKNINICSDPILKDHLSQQGIDAHTFDSILSREEKIDMLESLEGFASNWFLNEEGIDYTEYRNISIGAAVYDEVRILFQLLAHFIFVIDKLDPKNGIVFFHSTSCLMPNVIIEFLSQFNVTIRLIDERYPWLSYREQFDNQGKSNFSRISFNHNNEKYGGLRPKLGQIKLTLKQVLSRICCGIINKPKRNIYFHAHRSLVHFYDSYLKTKKNNFGIYITDTTPLEPRPDKKRLNIFQDICQIFRLARKGVVLDSLKCPFYYKWHVNHKKIPVYKKMTADLYGQVSKKTAGYLRLRNKALSKHFTQTFEEFYRSHLTQFMKLIDFYYDKFNRIKVDLCLQEMCHPFQSQVLANLGIPCRIYPSNYIIHNQYFAPSFLKRTKHFVKPIAYSDLDAERFNKLGFDKDNIKKIDRGFFKSWSDKIRPIHSIKSLKGKKILILAPSIIAMHTFRYQVQSESLYSFFPDVLEVLSEVRVSSVTIRPHPGAGVRRNQFGYTDNDILKYLVDKIEPSKKNLELKFSNSYYNNFESDILANDIALGNMSGALFEVLVYGRDYIYFDDTITPSYGVKDWTIFNEGTIKLLRTKEELRDYLTHYTPSNLEELRMKLFESNIKENIEDPFNLL